MANSRAWKFARLLNSDGKVKADKTELRDGAAFTGNVDFNQGADVTGDITVTGNVDGVDVSAFKSDYDSHNHDGRYYTETEADSRFVNVTGDTVTGSLSVSGSLTSGSNAVFHDGYHPNADKWTTARTLSLSGDASGSVSWDGSANATLSVTVANDSHTHSNYLLNTSDTLNGILTVNTTSDYQISLSSSNSWTGFAFNDSGGVNDYIWYNGVNGTFAIGGGGSNVSGKKLHVDGGMSVGVNTDATSTPTNGIYSEGAISVGGNTVWHAGNDGSGSGLDADLLDGVHGSAYARTNTSSVTFDGGTSTTVNVKCDDAGNARLNLCGDGQGTGILFVGQSTSYGGGIQYNGDNSPAFDGSGADYISLYRVTAGTVAWTARSYYSSNDWQFRGNVTAYASDERLKENIQPISDAVAKVQQLNGVTYDWRDECESLGFMPSMKSETGVIAQNVQKVIPDAVTEAPFNSTSTTITGEERNYLTVDKEKIIPLLIEAIKEQQAQIDELKAKLEV